MQLDIFEHSRDVMLRNAVIDALHRRDAAAAEAAIAALAGEFAGDPLLAPFRRLVDRLAEPPVPVPDAAVARRMLASADDAETAARRVFGYAAEAWLLPVWTELAAALAELPFDPADEGLHAVPLLLRAGRWSEAASRIETILSWRRQPVPLAWMVQAECRGRGLDSAWPLYAELAWMAPGRAMALAPRLGSAELDGLVRRFDAQFEGEGDGQDFAWFPAWALIVHPALSAAMRLARPGAGTPAERGAFLLLNLLLLERQGRHADIIDARRRLRGLQPRLFELYMQTR